LCRDYSDDKCSAVVRAIVANPGSQRHCGRHGRRVEIPSVDLAIVAAVEGGVTADVPVRLRAADVLHRQRVCLMKVRMGVPLAQHPGPLGDPLERERGVHHALRLTATPEVMRHRAVDLTVLSVDEAEVLVLRGTRTIDRELLANMLYDFSFEAWRRTCLSRRGRKAHRKQYPRRAEGAEGRGTRHAGLPGFWLDAPAPFSGAARGSTFGSAGFLVFVRRLIVIRGD